MSRTTSPNRISIRDMGTCLGFNGSTSIVSSTLWNSLTTSYSFGCWFKSNNWQQTRQVIMSNGRGDTGNRGLAIVLSGNLTTDGSIFALNHLISWNSCAFKVQNNNWNHIFFVVTAAGQVTSYLNGVNKGTISITGGLNTPSEGSYLGSDNGNTPAGINGYLDDCRVYGTALSDAQVLQIYQEGIISATPTNWYKLDEGSGTTATDNGSSAKNGTIANAVYSTEVFSIPRSAASNRPSPSSFSPADISGLKLWFKADALALNDLDTVSSWTDSSSNANHLVATSAPVYRTNQINGLPAVVFTSDFMETASISMSQWTTFMVFTPGGGSMYVLSWGPAGSEGRHFISNFVTDTAEYYNSPRISLGGTTNGTWSIHSAKISGSDTTTYKNGVQVATSGTVASDGTGIFRVGNYASGGANPFTGSIAEIIVYESALSSGDLDDVHNYLAEKYGIS